MLPDRFEASFESIRELGEVVEVPNPKRWNCIHYREWSIISKIHYSEIITRSIHALFWRTIVTLRPKEASYVTTSLVKEKSHTRPARCLVAPKLPSNRLESKLRYLIWSDGIVLLYRISEIHDRRRSIISEIHYRDMMTRAVHALYKYSCIDLEDYSYTSS